MSQKTGISSEEKASTKTIKEQMLLRSIFVCSCGKLHEFKLYFEKEYFIAFGCGTVKLIQLNGANDYHEKCKKCGNEIEIENDYFEKTDKNTNFFCKKCHSKKNENMTPISKIINKNDEKRNDMDNKFGYFINNNGKNEESELYRNNLYHVQLLRKFIYYLFFLRKLYSKKSHEYTIISNFLEYSKELLDIATKNINIYDLYHFNKEVIIYGCLFDVKKKFLSPQFKSQYNRLLIKCKKKKFLSIEMLKSIYRKYEEAKLINYLENDLMLEKYCKIKEIDFGRKVFLEATELRMKVLDVKLILSNLETDSELIKLKAVISKLEDELRLERYFKSFLEVPGQFSIFRKCASLILNKIIEKNQEKLNFIEPSESIINSTKYIISLMNKQLSSLKEDEMVNSIKKKISSLETILNKYKNYKTNKGKDKIKSLRLPIIKLEEDEKTFLSKNINMDEYYRSGKKISVENDNDKELEVIINYFFELREKTSRTIHVNDKENQKFYFFQNDKSILPKKEEDDDLDKALEKIKEIIENFPKSEEITYIQLVEFLFGNKNNEFIMSEKKINYLLSFLNLKLKQLSNNKDNYEKIKKKLKSSIKRIRCVITLLQEESDNIKYEKFISIYQLNVNAKEIFEYLNCIVDYIFCKNEEENESDSDEENEEDTIDIFNEFKKKEEQYREKIKDLIKKDQKFNTYIPIYLNVKLKEYIDENIQDLNIKINEVKKNILKKNLLLLQLEKIKTVIFSLKLYNFDTKTHFENFIQEYDETLPKKLLKISENERVDAGISNFNVFVEKIKAYIGDVDENVEITGKEPSQFLLNLFLKKIGLSWS